jgi:hypothetical protein
MSVNKAPREESSGFFGKYVFVSSFVRKGNGMEALTTQLGRRTGSDRSQ